MAGERSYRYPGSPPFRDVDLDRRLFKGRDEEAKKVFHSILSADVFLLYAVSGMGKSSLLNAGVMYRLREPRVLAGQRAPQRHHPQPGRGDRPTDRRGRHS